MKLYEAFFWGVCFFLIGVFIASIVYKFSQAYPIAAMMISIAAAIFLVFKRYSLAAFSVFMILGAAYYFAYDFYQQKTNIVFGQKIKITGIVSKAESRPNSQVLVIDNIQITAPRYPVWEYGDQVTIEGVIKKPQVEFENYYAKEGIAGLISFPKLELVSKGHGSRIKVSLFKIKSHFEDSYKKVLPFEQAAFMSGLTLGSTAEFSDEFKEKMRLTGTTHLVALSGYNISIIVRYLGGVFALWWVTKKFKLPLSVLAVIGFVVMTGAEPSVVRAAIMAMILLLADKIGRTAYIPNVIAATALVMILINPKILVFDVGFQLSFMALIGIIYLEPWLRKRFRAKDEPGFLGWRSNFWTTTSAQLAVLPIIVYQFGFVSPVSIPANVFLLEFIPLTMGLGFFIGFAAIVNYWLSWIIALPAAAFLSYELTIIDIFSRIMNIF